MKPFLKWAGNKYRILHKITAMLPPGRRLIEPFAGSAAVFLNTGYERNMINDVNSDVINLYITLKEHGSVFIDLCKDLFVPENNTPETYYEFRDEFNKTSDVLRKSALFVYLNRYGYNGLCRYNRRGGFNVPFGRYKKPYFPYAELMHFHQKSQTAEFLSEDFEAVMRRAVSGDVIYCDPPYTPLSDTANFTSYYAGGFSEQEQHRLANVAEELAHRGVSVLISNHDNEFTRETYASAQVESFEVQRFISCDGGNRNKASELLALYPADASAYS